MRVFLLSSLSTWLTFLSNSLNLYVILYLYSFPAILISSAPLIHLERNGTKSSIPTPLLSAILSITDLDEPLQHQLICRMQIMIEDSEDNVSYIFEVVSQIVYCMMSK